MIYQRIQPIALIELSNVTNNHTNRDQSDQLTGSLIINAV
jgi:hypothetical protein